MTVANNELLSIGRFAQLAGLTAKALRHYDELGLLRPAYVDDFTGYRWYSLEQARDAVAIRRLRAFELPLDEWRLLWESLERDGIRPRGEPREHYETSPDEVNDPSEHVTRLVWPLGPKEE